MSSGFYVFGVFIIDHGKNIRKMIKKLYAKTDIINAIEDIMQKRLTISIASSKYNIF